MWCLIRFLRSCGQPQLHRPGGPILSCSVAPPNPINLLSLHDALPISRANMDKENQPEMAERKHAGDPGRFLARPISLASYPVATGRPLPGPRARVRVIEEVNAGGSTGRHRTRSPRLLPCASETCNRPLAARRP